MSEFRKKPVVIEARELTVENSMEIAAWCGGTCYRDPDGGFLIVPTLEGNHTAKLGDFIIRGVKGEFYPCKPDIFALTYEPAAPAPAGAPDGKVETLVRVYTAAPSQSECDEATRTLREGGSLRVFTALSDFVLRRGMYVENIIRSVERETTPATREDGK